MTKEESVCGVGAVVRYPDNLQYPASDIIHGTLDPARQVCAESLTRVFVTTPLRKSSGDGSDVEIVNIADTANCSSRIESR